jgi:hypothetical protein
VWVLNVIMAGVKRPGSNLRLPGKRNSLIHLDILIADPDGGTLLQVLQLDESRNKKNSNLSER